MMKSPPHLADQLLRLFCAPHLREEVLGDLHERYYLRVKRVGEANARLRYWQEVLAYVRPSMMKQEKSKFPNPTTTDMLRNYLKIAFRNLVKNKFYSFINIGGLAVGMAVAMLIGLWIYDEVSFNKQFQNYDRIAQVMQNNTLNGEIHTWESQPFPLAAELRNSYGSDFQYVLMTSGIRNHILAFADKKIAKSGSFVEPQAPDMLTLNMIKGSRAGLKDPASILLSESLANAFFGKVNPIGKILKIDNKLNVRVTGVYEDLPYASSFRDISYMAPWDLYLADNDWIKKMDNPWGSNVFQIFVEVTPKADLANVSEKIKFAKLNKVAESQRKNKPELFLYPMAKWHLYSVFKNGVSAGGRIEFVWLFGIIGVFVLLLACINFMNLSTARSEKRAKEIGIRKAVGSVRRQLITQFLSESLVVVAFAFVLALMLTGLIIPFFNEVVDKKLSIPWTTIYFWGLSIGFSLITGLMAGSYPAFYLASFQPVNVLKGTFRIGRLSVLPRKVLVVFQFTVSVILITGTLIVFRQIQFSKNRSVGYSREGLIMLKMITPDIHNQFDILRDELKKIGAIVEMAESSAPPTGIWATDGDFEWKGKDPELAVDFPNTGISFEYGKTVGWQFKDGRDFSREFATDSSGFIVNEAAVRFMGLKKPIGEIIKWNKQPFTIIGVIKDMVVESPYQPVRPSMFSLAKSHDNFAIIRLSPTLTTREALTKIETVFKQYTPTTPFDYQFVDEEYAKKFGDEERIGKLASFFAILAIFISCLGLFGLASFVAEQRTKEIGVRKVLGASVLNLWGLLSKDFVLLVVIAFGIATPIAYYFLHNWLQKYEYRTEISWWIFAASGAGALVVTLLTVSFQSIKAALMNPVRSLRSE